MRGGVLRRLPGLYHIENGENEPQSVGFQSDKDDNFAVYTI